MIKNRILLLSFVIILILGTSACQNQKAGSGMNNEEWQDYSSYFGMSYEDLKTQFDEKQITYEEEEELLIIEEYNEYKLQVYFGNPDENDNSMESYYKLYITNGKSEEDKKLAVDIFNELLKRYGSPDQSYDRECYECDDWNDFTEMMMVGNRLGEIGEDHNRERCTVVNFIWFEKEFYYRVYIYDDETVSFKVLFAHDGNWMYG